MHYCCCRKDIYVYEYGRFAPSRDNANTLTVIKERIDYADYVTVKSYKTIITKYDILDSI